MHEVSVVSSIIEAVLAELKKHGAAKADEITVVIGDLTSLGEEQMEFAYGIMTKDTELDGSSIHFEREPVTLRCIKCGHEGQAETLQNDFYNHTVPIISCPKCGGQAEILSGQSCRIRSMTIREEE